MLSVLQVVIAPHVGHDGMISVTGPERRAANLASKWKGFDVEVVVCYPARGTMRAKFLDAGLEVIDFEIGSKFNFASIGQLVRIIKQHQIQIVHAQGPASLDLMVAFAALLAGVKVVITRPVMIEDQVTYSTLRRRVYSLIDRMSTLRLVDRVVAVSHAGIEHLKNYCGVSDKKLGLIHNGVDLKRFEQAVRRGANGRNAEQRVTLGMVAQLFPPKGWHDYIEVVERLVRQGLSIKALVIGEGHLRDELEALVKAKNLTEVVEFTGFQDNVSALYSMMDIFLFTTHREGLSVAVIEGMASGLPFVATEVGGIREQIIEGENGYVVPVRDIELLTQRTAELIRNPALRETMGRKSRELALERFDESRMLEQYVACYRSLL